jgi:hypothetical protein
MQFKLSVLALAALGSANTVPTQNVYSGEIRIEAYRHGATCANFVYECKPDNLKWGGCVKEARDEVNAGDSFLSHAGLKGSKSVGEIISNVGSGKGKPDIVFVSNMMSTMETGLEMFPGRVLYVAPYIVDTNEANKPQPVATQLELMRPTQGSKVDKLDFTFMDEVMANVEDKGCRNGQSSPRCTGDFDAFLEWFTSKLTDPQQLTSLPQLLQDKIANQQDIIVAISGHGTQNRAQIINADKKYKIWANMGHYADYKLVVDNDGDNTSYYLDRIDDDSDELWNVMENTVDYPVDECENNNFDILDRCYQRNPKQWNIILGAFQNPKDDCPSGDEAITVDPYPVPVAVEEPVITDENNTPAPAPAPAQTPAVAIQAIQGRKIDSSDPRFSKDRAQLVYYNGTGYVF